MRFQKTFCSQCGGTFGPGDSGYSHCISRSPKGDDAGEGGFVASLLRTAAAAASSRGVGAAGGIETFFFFFFFFFFFLLLLATIFAENTDDRSLAHPLRARIRGI